MSLFDTTRSFLDTTRSFLVPFAADAVANQLGQEGLLPRKEEECGREWSVIAPDTCPSYELIHPISIIIFLAYMHFKGSGFLVAYTSDLQIYAQPSGPLLTSLDRRVRSLSHQDLIMF